MTPASDINLPVRRRRRGSAIMVWLFAAIAALVFAVFLVQVSGFDIEELTSPAAPAPELAAPSQQTKEQERFAVQGSEVAGFDEDQQPYRIAAVEARQDKQSANLVHMRQITGLLHRPDGRALDVSAKAGLFNSKDKSLRLTGDVTITLLGSFVATMEFADVDVQRKALKSDVGVVVAMDGGQITSDGIDVIDNGSHVTFLSNVKAVFETQDQATQPVSQQQNGQTSSKGNLQQ